MTSDLQTRCSATARSAAEMINRCFRHQHPEAYGRREIPEPRLPANLHFASDPPVRVHLAVPEATMGDPDAVLLPD
jgi:hypothetical protein